MNYITVNKFSQLMISLINLLTTGLNEIDLGQNSDSIDVVLSGYSKLTPLRGVILDVISVDRQFGRADDPNLSDTVKIHVFSYGFGYSYQCAKLCLNLLRNKTADTFFRNELGVSTKTEQVFSITREKIYFGEEEKWGYGFDISFQIVEDDTIRDLSDRINRIITSGILTEAGNEVSINVDVSDTKANK